MRIKIGAIPSLYPVPITLVGAEVAGNPNFITIGDVGLIGINPPTVSISSHAQYHTSQGILENETFSIQHRQVFVGEEESGQKKAKQKRDFYVKTLLYYTMTELTTRHLLPLAAYYRLPPPR